MGRLVLREAEESRPEGRRVPGRVVLPEPGGQSTGKDSPRVSVQGGAVPRWRCSYRCPNLAPYIPQPHGQWCQADGLKPGTVGVFTPWKSAEPTNLLSFPSQSRLSNIYLHTPGGEEGRSSERIPESGKHLPESPVAEGRMEAGSEGGYSKKPTAEGRTGGPGCPIHSMEPGGHVPMD